MVVVRGGAVSYKRGTPVGPLYGWRVPLVPRRSCNHRTTWQACTGVPRALTNAPSYHPAVGTCKGPYGGPWGGAVLCERTSPLPADPVVAAGGGCGAPAQLCNPTGVPHSQENTSGFAVSYARGTTVWQVCTRGSRGSRHRRVQGSRPRTSSHSYSMARTRTLSRRTCL